MFSEKRRKRQAKNKKKQALLLRRLAFFFLLRNKTENENDKNQSGENVAEIGKKPRGHLDALSGVAFKKIGVLSPAELVNAEQEIDERADGEKQIGDNEILKVKDAFAEKRDVRPKVVGEDGGETSDKHENAV